MNNQINYEDHKVKEVVIKVTGLEAVHGGMFLLNICLELMPLQI